MQFFFCIWVLFKIKSKWTSSRSSSRKKENNTSSLIKDDIPDGLEFISYIEGDGSTNDTYRWKLVDEDNQEVTDPSKAKYIITDYLSKENESEGSNLIKAFDKDTMEELDYRDVKVEFKVTEPNTSDRIVINQAQISKETDKEGNDSAALIK